MFRHVVSFKLADDKKDMMDEAKKRLLALNAIDEVVNMQVGINEFKSERSFDFVIVVDFKNLEDYEVYDNHELHNPVRDFIHEIISDAVAVDYFVE
ncbi:MAG: Dabb family protein [Clostridia bacterium]|jgi:hypothetical protein|nr:Dabb family protein [Clostridia bacterium]MBT7122737.1 Dabb family protein [Clostridia bacterium]